MGLIRNLLNIGVEAVNPVGTIISYFGKTAPDGYLSCDGSTYNRTDYPELAQHLVSQFADLVGDGTTTFKVPDLRGEFLRGTGTNSYTKQGSGEAVGVHQDATEHVVIQPTTTTAWIGGGDTTTEAKVINPDVYPSKNSDLHKLVQATTTLSSGTFDSRFTSRPTNTSVLYCIKF